jgi:hypothetical protein
MSDVLVSVVLSRNLSKGFPAGYGLVVTKTKLAGAKQYVGDFSYAAYLGTRSKVSDEDREQAKKLAYTIEKKKEFDVRLSEVSSIEIKEPGKLSAGHLLVKTNQGEFKVNITGTWGTGSEDVLSILSRSLNEVAADKLTDT